jgi:hypothetical protein
MRVNMGGGEWRVAGGISGQVWQIKFSDLVIW